MCAATDGGEPIDSRLAFTVTRKSQPQAPAKPVGSCLAHQPAANHPHAGSNSGGRKDPAISTGRKAQPQKASAVIGNTFDTEVDLEIAPVSDPQEENDVSLVPGGMERLTTAELIAKESESFDVLVHQCLGVCFLWISVPLLISASHVPEACPSASLKTWMYVYAILGPLGLCCLPFIPLAAAAHGNMAWLRCGIRVRVLMPVFSMILGIWGLIAWVPADDERCSDFARNEGNSKDIRNTFHPFLVSGTVIWVSLVFSMVIFCGGFRCCGQTQKDLAPCGDIWIVVDPNLTIKKKPQKQRGVISGS